MDASECDEGREGVSEVLVIFGQAAVSAEPRKGPFDNPATRQDDKSCTVVGTFDDLHPQRRLRGDGVFDLAGVVAAIGPDEFEPIEALADAIKHQGGAVPVLNGGGVNHHAQGQAFGIDQSVDFAPLPGFRSEAQRA